MSIFYFILIELCYFGEGGMSHLFFWIGALKIGILSQKNKTIKFRFCISRAMIDLNRVLRLRSDH